MRLLASAVFVLLLGSSAIAEPVQLRMAVVAPEGTSFAREVLAFSREVEAATQHRVQLKWYFGGIAGDELAVLERIRRGQLDGTSGSLMCSQLAPSLRVTRLLGMFRDRAEFHYVLDRLRPRVHAEMLEAGFADLGLGNFGDVVVFSRKPIRSMAQLRATRLWSWSLDDVWRATAPALGLHTIPSEVTDAGRAYDERRVDALASFPTAALAFQWSARSRFFSDLSLGALPACIVIALRALDPLPIADQKEIREAAARLAIRFEERGREDDAALLGGLFERQGLHKIHADPVFRADFLEAAAAARDKVGPTLVPPALLSAVLAWLADYRADHR